MSKGEEQGVAAMRIQRMAEEPLAKYCARLSEEVFSERLSTWSMLKTAESSFPENSELEISLAVHMAIEDRRKEMAWTL